MRSGDEKYNVERSKSLEDIEHEIEKEEAGKMKRDMKEKKENIEEERIQQCKGEINIGKHRR